MKKLVSIKDFKKSNENSVLKTDKLIVINGGNGTWKHERHHTNEQSGYGHTSDHEDWYYGDGDNRGHIKGSVTYISVGGGVCQESVVNI